MSEGESTGLATVHSSRIMRSKGMDRMSMYGLAALIMAILAPMAAITISFAILLSNQLRASERRLIGQVRTTELSLTEQHREISRDTRSLVRHVGLLRGRLGPAPGRLGDDPGGAA